MKNSPADAPVTKEENEDQEGYLAGVDKAHALCQ
jgi:hypothetical protein